MLSRGFFGRRRPPEVESRLPPGQYFEKGFPVLTVGPTPRTPLERWSFTLKGLSGSSVSWSWDEFRKLPSESYIFDIHCVTKWTKLDTKWTGVSVDTLLQNAELPPSAAYVMAFSDGGYTTNIPLAELVNGQAFVAYEFDGAPLPAEHGGPARLVVPHLYFWKSAKWVRGFQFMDRDEPGFWEANGYNMHGDPWKEERYSGD
jgi:DMSO/TMAO reductase YedYZ molybdopterin-dependent catalytic subunit